MQDMLEAVLAELPNDGSEIDYDEWRNRVALNVSPFAVQQIQKARKTKRARFRVIMSDDMTEIIGHKVSLAQAQGGNQ